MAGQRLSLSPSLLSQWNCYTNCCPSSRAGDYQRLHRHADETSQPYPIARTNHSVILPISSIWGQVLILTFGPRSESFKTVFAGGGNHSIGAKHNSELGIHKRNAQELLENISRRRTCSLPLPPSKSAFYLASSLDPLSRLFLWPSDLPSRVSPWTKGSASTQRGCAVLTGVERRSSVCSPSGSARTLWLVPSTGLSNRAQSHHRRRQRTSEPLTLG